MIENDGTQDVAKYRAFSATMSQLKAAGRRMRRRRDKRTKRRSLFRLLMPGQAPAPGPILDPVKLAVLAIDSVAGASMRAAFTGMEVHVAAPDEATAAILRAALAETARNRATDRLIRITVR